MGTLTTPTATATLLLSACTYMYLNAKLHLHKDLRALLRRAAVRRAIARAARADRLSPYYFIEARARDPSLANKEAIWAKDIGGNVATYTFEEVLERANQFGRWFLSRGVKRGDLVGLFMVNSAEFLFAWVGLWAVGAAPAMVNYHLRGETLVHCLKVSGARLVVVDGDEAAWGRVGEVMGTLGEVRFVGLADVMEEMRGVSAERLPDTMRNGVRGTDPMALFYTSGTTARPKACALPVAVTFAHWRGITAGTNPMQGSEERYYVCMPYYHGTGGISVMAQLIAGNTVCVAPKFSVSNFWRDIRDSRATWFVYVGETLRYLLAAPPSPLDRQHRVHSIHGNGLRPDVWQRFRSRFGIVQVFEFFNSTEGMLALVNPSLNDYTAHAVGHHGFLQRWTYHRYYVPVAVNAETGEIARNPKTGLACRMPYEVGGEMLVELPFEKGFLGYWRDPEATEKKLVRDVFRKGDCYYRTGDALRRDSEGRWFFLDRLGDTFRWKGENVSTAEVSEVLGRYPGVLEANVYGVQLPCHDGKAGVAAVHLDPSINGTFDYQDFLRHARTHLPRYAVPLFLRHLQTPSSTHNNKQNKMPLKREGVDPDKVAPGDAVVWVERYGKGATYIPFTRQDWEDLQIGKAKL